MRTKLRNLLTGKIIEKTFRAGEGIEEANVEKVNALFFFPKKDEFVFKSTDDPSELYKTTQVILGTASKFLKPQLEVKLVLWDRKVSYSSTLIF